MNWTSVLHGCNRTTTRERLAAALVVGAVSGGAITALAFSLTDLLVDGQNGVWVLILIVAFFVATFIWGAGLFVLAWPIWMVMDRVGARCRVSAMILGAGLNVLLTTIRAIFAYDPTTPGAEAGWMNSFLATYLAIALALGVAGAIVGAIVWTVAYRPVRTVAVEAVFG